jgi:hypothetical protein
MKNTVKESSVVNKFVGKSGTDQFTMPTWGLIVVLFIALFVIKSFIYIKDPKRHNQ